MQMTIPTPYPVGDVHVYLVKGDTLSLIDAGVRTDEAWDIFKNQLKGFGYLPEDIEQVILTHHHPDHTGFVDRFDCAHGIYGHKRNQPWLRRDETFLENYLHFFQQLYRDFGIPNEFKSFQYSLKGTLKYGGIGELTGFLQEHDTLPGHPDWQVIETPGHARSHLSFYNGKDKSLLAGDHVLAHISPNPLLEPPDEQHLPRPKPLLEHREALKKLLPYEIDAVYAGHGPIFHGVQDIIHKRLQKQEARADKVYHLLQDKPLTVYETTKKLFPTKYQSQLGLTLSETVGQLDYLESIGKVNISKEEDAYVYTAN